MKKKTKKSDNTGIIALGLLGLGGLGYLMFSKKDTTPPPPAITQPPTTPVTQGTGIIASPHNMITNIFPSGTSGGTIPATTMTRAQALGIIVAAKSGRIASSYSTFGTGFLIDWASGITSSYINKSLTTFTSNNKKYYIATGTAV